MKPPTAIAACVQAEPSFLRPPATPIFRLASVGRPLVNMTSSEQVVEWMWDNAGEGSTRYVAYSDAHSQLLEQSFRTSGAKATTTLSLGKRVYTVRKTRKGWVQEVGGQPELWRAVKRVQRDSGTTPTMLARAVLAQCEQAYTHVPLGVH